MILEIVANEGKRQREGKRGGGGNTRKYMQAAHSASWRIDSRVNYFSFPYDAAL